MCVGLLGGCLSVPSAFSAPAGESQRPSFSRAVLTADHTTLRVRGDRRRLVVRATGTGEFWNRRELISLTGASTSRNQTSCATWARSSDPMAQEGVAVRIQSRPRRVRAVTVTKNTIHGMHGVFNVMTWDTARSGEPWRSVAQFDLSAVVAADGHVLPLPWRVCVRVVGRSLSFKVWLPAETSEPSWRNRTHVRQVRLPRGYVAAGKAGWYVGHVPGGGSVVYRGLVTR
ncbi:hypothetical protein GCM10027026_06020 [Myroides odoratimimus subsp. xuanwuensis]